MQYEDTSIKTLKKDTALHLGRGEKSQCSFYAENSSGAGLPFKIRPRCAGF